LEEAKKASEDAAAFNARLYPPRKLSDEKLIRRRIAKRLRKWKYVSDGGAPDSGGWGYARRKDGKLELLYKGYLSRPPRVVAVFEKDLEGLVQCIVGALLHESALIPLALELVRDKATTKYLQDWEQYTRESHDSKVCCLSSISKACWV
jgi:hypothetical protein